MSNSNLHFLIIPLMCPGHLIPMVDMAKLIAQHCVNVTIVITPRNADRYAAVLHRAIASELPIKILNLPFPASEYGLPDGCESVDDLPSFNLSKNFFDACSTLQKPIEDMFNELKPAPCCIISDKHLPWTFDVAKKFRIPWVIFDGMSCFTQLATHNLCVSKDYEQLTDSDMFMLPGLPDNIYMTKVQLPGLFNPGSSKKGKELKSVREGIRAKELEAYGTVINSFEEMETKYVDEFKKLKQGRVWCIGPFSNSNKNDLDRAQRGSKDSMIKNDECVKWLDSQRDCSVIYVCLGSLTRLTPLQFIELALGLEDSQFPFVLVVKGGMRTEEIEKWLDENGFESRIKGRGVLIRGWAPQVLILSHRVVGAFLTHCGWNSTIEGVCAGVPMITWPQFAEQFFNERLVVQVLGVGVGVGATRVMHLEDEAAPMQVTREDVCRAVKVVMDEGKEGEERRKKAKCLKQMAEKAIEEGGSSYNNLDRFIEDIRAHTSKGVVS
ncbi:hypothetical protein QVD17_11659 [Tagetes erecta]|uniref:Glycosyltransferase n=1 Tax=Tagetes erecta TaxID=13708 RepID=A0AAD8NV62_TARER|nr:hypothetical protein QVD17_11659 [Tagetes erecta]